MHWRTKLLHLSQNNPQKFNSLTTPIHRASTVVFDKTSDVIDSWRQKKHGYTYGVFGSPTVVDLGNRISSLDGSYHSFILPGGQAAITTVYLTFCQQGSHVLVPNSAYTPNRDLGLKLLNKFGVEIETYDPSIGSDIIKLIKPNTHLIWTESPGSITMEIQDIPAIVKIAKANKIPVALDNTYSAGVLFDAFSYGIDISIQALTKYVSGHSDVILGSISVSNESYYEKIGSTWSQLGLNVSPDDACLALRGLQTLGIRLEKLEINCLQVAKWLKDQPVIDLVLHPAMSDCVGHEIWKRDFTGSASVFSFVFKDSVSEDDVIKFVENLKLFKLGFSWGGTQSLVMLYPGLKRPNRNYNNRLVRLNVGLEEPSDLIDDLNASLQKLTR